MSQFPGKVPCEGYFDTKNELVSVKTGKRGRPIKKWVTRQVPVACPTGSDKSASAARCKQCHALYREAKKMAPIDTPMGKEQQADEFRTALARDAKRQEREAEIESRFRTEVAMKDAGGSGSRILQAKGTSFILPRLSKKREDELATEYWRALSKERHEGKSRDELEKIAAEVGIDPSDKSNDELSQILIPATHDDRYRKIDTSAIGIIGGNGKPAGYIITNTHKTGKLLDGALLARNSMLKDSMGRVLKDKHRNYLNDDSGIPIAEIYYGIPPHPGKRAKEERGHLEYDYQGRLFDDKAEDVNRKGSDWWFTTWTVSPLADISPAKMTTPTITTHTKSGRKRVHPVSRSVAEMTTGQFDRALGSSKAPIIGSEEEVRKQQAKLSKLRSLSPDEYARTSGIKDANFVFQCFDCGRHKKGGAGGKILDKFCKKCSEIGIKRSDALWKSQAKKSNSVFFPLEKIDIGHPQKKNAMGRTKEEFMDPDDGLPFVRHIDRYFVKKRSNQHKEIELWDGFF